MNASNSVEPTRNANASEPLEWLAPEELFMLKCLKTISPLFSAWRDHTMRQKMSLNSVLVLGNWKLQNRAWVKWVTTKKRREGLRHSEALTRDLKKAHENQTKADRHYRLTTLSKVYLAWHAWHKIEMENKKLQRRHQERSKKVQDFLKAMEEQVANARRRPLSPLSPPSPPPPPPATIVQNISSSHTIPFCNVADICGAESSLRDTCPHASKSATIKVRKGKLRQIDSVAKQQPPFTIIIPASSPITAAAAAAAKQININSTSHAPTKPKPAAIIKSLKNPDILQQMKKREAERLERRNAVEQKKREREQEIQAKKDQEERERIEREETEKRRYIELKLEERRLRKMAEEEKGKEKEKRAQNVAKAISHYHKTLLKRKGLTPLKINVACHRNDEALAFTFRQKWDCLPSVLKWRRKLQDKREQVELQASLVYEKNLVCRVWKEFSQKYKTEKSKESLAQSHYMNQKSHSVFAKWIQKAKESVFTRLQNEREKERKAVLLAEKLMPRRYLRKWRAIVAELKEEQCREWRREQLRSRIKEMLTVSKFEEKLKRDYTPPMRRGFAVDLDE
ncbi:hypothetical protein BDR26DRAFT_284307 [Obelidium mucronatum]|nr:hypothetical protein BDR26DRAFT_284307 [Obelidium mucronatum]